MKRFLHVLIGCYLTLWPCYAQTQSISKQKYPRDGKIRIYVYHTDTFADLDYLDANGDWNEDVYQRMITLLRSYTDGKTLAIDKRLIELADHLQDHFDVDTVEIISAYRSPEYNAELFKAGHNVAKESLHTQGLAIDMHFDEIDESAVRDYLHGLNLGGVGYYGKNLFVHADFGDRNARWTDSLFTHNTEIGIFNRNTLLRLRTDQFYYTLGRVVVLQGIPNAARIENFSIQHFFRGQWRDICAFGDQDCTQMFSTRIDGGRWSLPSAQIVNRNQNRFGKYRVRYNKDAVWQNSNEFYIKK